MIKGEIDATVLKYRWYAQAPYYRAYAHQVDFLQQLKNQLPYKLRGTSEGSETWAQEYLTRRIQICRVYFCLGVTYLESY